MIITPLLWGYYDINGMEPAPTRILQKEVNKDLKAILAKTIATKFKHALLNHNFQERKSCKHSGPLHITSFWRILVGADSIPFIS